MARFYQAFSVHGKKKDSQSYALVVIPSGALAESRDPGEVTLRLSQRDPSTPLSASLGMTLKASAPGFESPSPAYAPTMMLTGLLQRPTC